MEQVKLTYVMLLWEYYRTSVGAEDRNPEYQHAMRQHLNFIIHGFESGDLEIVDLDEVTFEDFKAFLKNYSFRGDPNYRMPLYYHPRDGSPNYRDIFSREDPQRPDYSSFVGKLANVLAQVQKDGKLPQMSQNRQIAHLEFLIYELTHPGLLQSWFVKLNLLSDVEIKARFLTLQSKIDALFPLLTQLEQSGVKVFIAPEQVKIFDFWFDFLKFVESSRSLRQISKRLQDKYELLPKQVEALDEILLRKKLFKGDKVPLRIREDFVQKVHSVLEL